MSHHDVIYDRDFEATCIDLNVERHCMQLTGYMACFKISLAFAFFFVGMAAATMGVTAEGGIRANWHNQHWVIKVNFHTKLLLLAPVSFQMLAILTLLVGVFVIPISQMANLHTAW